MRKLSALKGLFLGIVAGVLFGLGGLEAIAYFKRPSPEQQLIQLMEKSGGYGNESYTF